MPSETQLAEIASQIDPLYVGDRIAHVAAWKQGNDLGRLAGQAIRLRVVLKDADLYAIRFH